MATREEEYRVAFALALEGLAPDDYDADLRRKKAEIDQLDLAGRQRVVRGLIHRITVWPDRWEPILK